MTDTLTADEIAALHDAIASVESDMASDLEDAEETGERVDLYEYEVTLPYSTAVALDATVTAQQREIERLRAFVAEFAAAKFEQIHNRPRNWRGPEDDLDPVTDWMAIDAWQDDARGTLAQTP